jgi:hypothetical protein
VSRRTWQFVILLVGTMVPGSGDEGPPFGGGGCRNGGDLAGNLFVFGVRFAMDPTRFESCIVVSFSVYFKVVRRVCCLVGSSGFGLLVCLVFGFPGSGYWCRLRCGESKQTNLPNMVYRWTMVETRDGLCKQV